MRMLCRFAGNPHWHCDRLFAALLVWTRIRPGRLIISGLLVACLLVAPSLGKAGDEEFPNFVLSIQPEPIYEMQEVRVGIGGPDCYFYFSDIQFPHIIQHKGPNISYDLPMGVGMPPIGCTNVFVTGYFPIGQFSAGSYELTVRVYNPYGEWTGLIELGTIQFEVLPNLAVPQPQVVPANDWLSLVGLGALLALLGGLVLANRSGKP